MIESSEKFLKDIDLKDTTIYPVVVIGGIESSLSLRTDDTLRISSKSEILYLKRTTPNDEFGYDTYSLKFSDYNLKVGNIKESLDFEKSIYKVSSVRIELSNYNIDNYILSDRINDFYNKPISIYYKTSTTELFDDLLLVYNGIVREISHDGKKVNLTAEDRTDYIVHKDIPLANLGYKENVFNKDYVNKPIPMTYGKVAQAPVVPYIYKNSETGYSSIAIIPDDVTTITGNTRGLQINGFGTDEPFPENTYLYDLTSSDSEYQFNSNPLYIYKGDYFRVLQDYNKDANVGVSGLIDFPVTKQYRIEETDQNLSIFKEFIASYPQNPPAANELQTIKVRYPNQCTLLKSANILNGDIGSNSGVINVDVPDGILNPEAAIDNAFFTNADYSSVQEFDTFCEIPNQFSIIEESDSIEIHEVTPYNIDSNGWIHPLASNAGDVTDKIGNSASDYGGVTNRVNYLALMYNWCNTYMHKLPAVYVQLPPIDLIKEHVDEFLKGNYGSNMGANATIYNTSNESIFDTVREAEFRPQHNISPHFTANFVASTDCNQVTSVYGSDTFGRQNSEEFFVYQENQTDDFNTNEGQHWYYSESWTSNIKSRNYRYNCKSSFRLDQSTDWKVHRETAWEPLSGRLSHERGSTFYSPTNVYKFSQDYNNPNNVLGLTNVYVGLWTPETMFNSCINPNNSNMTPVGENAIFINLWNLEDGKPYLYESKEQFCIINPNHLTYKEKVGNNMKCRYNSDWNGVPINHWIDNDGNEQAYSPDYDGSCLVASGLAYYSAPNWGLGGADCDNITMKELVGNNASDSNQGFFGGKSWFILFEDEEPNGLKNLADAAGETGEDLGEWNDNGAHVRMPKNLLIPCNLKNYEGQYQGHNFNMDYIIDPNRKAVNISVGQGGTFEERLSVLFPMGDLEAEDSFHVDTFTYGKVNLNIKPESGDTHNLDSTTHLKLECIATDVVTVSEVDFNAEAPIGLHGTSLIDIEGDDNVFTSTTENTKSWDISSQTSNLNQFNGIFSNKIESWDTADKFNALSLVYRLEGTEPSHYAKISSEIYSLGLVQFVNFEKALDSSFYADVKGRTSVESIDDNWKYTNEYNGVIDIIEKPADILYHFIEKEISQTDLVDRESWLSNRIEGIDVNLAFSVKEVMNSKKIFEGISKNSSIYPVFNSEGMFVFKNLKSEYFDTDIDLIIKSDDVIKYEFRKTPISRIKTLVNVKYRKDYETGEYTRETGWCDALDFYGNKDFNDINGVAKKGYDYESFGLKREDNIHTFESDYIRDYNSAINLRNFIMMQNCNQHTLINITLPVTYLRLQTGDIVKFDKLIDNLKAHGEDYTSNDVYRNNQKIYPYFIVQSINKNSETIKVTLQQLHKLKSNFTAGIGSLSRKSERGISSIGSSDSENINEQYDIGDITIDSTYGNLNFEDLGLYEDYITGISSYFTTNQLMVGDIDNNNNIDINDLNIINILLGLVVQESETEESSDSDIILGDTNNDGIVNVTDVIYMVNYILNADSSEYTEEELIDIYRKIDMNQDGFINVSDVISVVNLILSDG